MVRGYRTTAGGAALWGRHVPSAAATCARHICATDTTRHASETVLREVRVLAVDQRVSDQEGTPAVAKTATLEVTPKQAEEIAVVMEIGRLSLALRSLPQETETGDEIIEPFGPTLTWDSQVSRVLQAPASVSSDGKPATTEVKVVRGSESQTLAFRRVQ